MHLRHLFLLVQALAVASLVSAPPAAAQDTPTEETVANLAAGRVVIAVVKDAIIVGTVENPIEAETRPPLPVAIGSTRIGVILGAVQWKSPSTQEYFARLNKELPQLHGHLIVPGPHLQNPQGETEASDIESIGQGLLERLSDVAQNLHAKVEMPASEPLAELVIADYLAGYGPEVWQLSYAMKQQEEQAGYWTTRVLRPSYLQFWPPEKGQPRTLVEFEYPLENPPPALLDLLRTNDPRLEKIRSSDAKMAAVAARFLEGESNKVLAADATQFLRAALDAIAPPNARETMAIIRQETGFDWILEPPPEPVAPVSNKQGDSGAPTLTNKPQ